MVIYAMLKNIFILFICLLNLNPHISNSLIYENEKSEISKDFEMEVLSIETYENILSKIDFSKLDEEPVKWQIECFDVNDDGLIAIGTSNSKTKRIVVYDSDGYYKYGYQFTSTGNFGIEWVNNKILIYFIRSNIVISVNEEGRINEIFKVENTLEYNTYLNNTIFSAKKNKNGVDYEIKNDLGPFNFLATSYSRLTITDSMGETKSLYDINFSQLVKYIIISIAVLIFIIIVFVAVIKFTKITIVKSKRRLN